MAGDNSNTAGASRRRTAPRRRARWWCCCTAWAAMRKTCCRSLIAGATRCRTSRLRSLDGSERFRRRLRRPAMVQPARCRTRQTARPRRGRLSRAAPDAGRRTGIIGNFLSNSLRWWAFRRVRSWRCITWRRVTRRLAAVVAYSGRLASAITAQTRTPLTLVHGVEDPVIPVLELERAANALSDAGFAVACVCAARHWSHDFTRGTLLGRDALDARVGVAARIETNRNMMRKKSA